MATNREDPFCHRHFRPPADCLIARTRHDRRLPLAICERRARALFQRRNPDQLVTGPSRPRHEE